MNAKALAEMKIEPEMTLEDIPEGERGPFLFGLCFASYTNNRRQRLLEELKTGFSSGSNPRSFALRQDEMDFGQDAL